MFLNNFPILHIPKAVIVDSYNLYTDEIFLYERAEKRLNMFEKPVTLNNIASEMKYLEFNAQEVLMCAQVLYN